MICMIRYFDYLFERTISISEIKMYQKMHKSNGSARNVIWNLLYMYHLEFRRGSYGNFDLYHHSYLGRILICCLGIMLPIVTSVKVNFEL